MERVNPKRVFSKLPAFTGINTGELVGNRDDCRVQTQPAYRITVINCTTMVFVELFQPHLCFNRHLIFFSSKNSSCSVS
jgi:hypothetical protein